MQRILSADIFQFDLKFTKGNTVVMPEKLKFLQKKHAQKSIEERGPMFDSMVQEIATLIEEYLQLYPEYVIFTIDEGCYFC